MSGTLLILPSSTQFQDSSNIERLRLIDTTPYYNYSKELIQLLLEIEAIILNPDNGLFEFSSFYINNLKEATARLLGFIAEAVVVRECNNYAEKNRKWANYARISKDDYNPMTRIIKSVFYKLFSDNPDNFKAIGTGLIKTMKNHPEYFCKTDDRDICWVGNYNSAKQLLSVEKLFVNRKYAGIQLKVSCANKGSYVTNYFKNKAYFQLYPVVYFDLGNDFYKVRDNLLNLSSNEVKDISLFGNNVPLKNQYSREEIVDMMLIRGRDIDNSLHEELLYYRHIVDNLFSGKTSLFNLSDESVISALIIEYLGGNVVKNQSKILTVYS